MRIWPGPPRSPTIFLSIVPTSAQKHHLIMFPLVFLTLSGARSVVLVPPINILECMLYQVTDPLTLINRDRLFGGLSMVVSIYSKL